MSATDMLLERNASCSHDLAERELTISLPRGISMLATNRGGAGVRQTWRRLITRPRSRCSSS